MDSTRSTQPSRLPRGPHALEPQEAAAVYRPRLHGAAVELIGEHGCAAVTVEGIATAAGVSTATFYALYPSKHALIIETSDALLDALRDRIQPAETPGNGLETSLEAAFAALVDGMLVAPRAARLLTSDVLELGSEGLARHRKLLKAVRATLTSAAVRDDQRVIGEAALAVMAGGALLVIDRHLRSGKHRALRASVGALAAWGSTYETRMPEALPPRTTQDELPPPATTLSRISLPRGRHGLPASFVRRHQRGRIIEAVRAVSAEDGFATSSLRDLIATSGLSHQTFYQHFSTKDEAWSAAFDEGFVGLFAAAWYAVAAHTDPVDQVTAAVEACIGFLEADPDRARLLLIDARSAGRPGQPAIDEAVQAFNRLLAGRGNLRELPPVVPLAVVGGIASLVAEWVADGRVSELGTLAPTLVRLILAPTIGAPAVEALHAAESRRQPAGDERERLIAAFADAVGQQGLRATKLSDVAQTVGVELDVVSSLFVDEIDCATQALDAWGSQLVVIAAGAFLAAAGDPPLAASRALDATLAYTARTPSMTALTVTDDPDLVPAISEMRTRFVSLFFQLIAGQVAPAEQQAPQPLEALQVVIDGVMAVVRRFVQEGRADELPGQLHALTLQCLTPFFGAAEAQRAFDAVALPAR
ncbi:MAG: TetR/AcrR family transcriptional regulator [Patulibacter sp.]|nr:TetR/AcrR family transcriptional regulator [Patulibacter sp.]